MYDFLKALFQNAEGQAESLTFEQLTERIAADSKLKIVNLADGGYVAKDKYDALDTKFKGVEKQLGEANDTIKSYEEMDIEGIKKSVTDWETKYNADTKALNEKLAAQARSHSEEQFLSGYKFTSKAAKDGVLATFRSKEFKLDENGTFLGGKEFMDNLMKDEDYKGAFMVDDPTPPPAPPADPRNPKWGNPNPGDPPPKPKKSLTELMKQKNEHPEMEIKFD